MPTRDVFVIGASAGGVEALSRLFHELPVDFPGSLFVVLHTLAGSESQLPRILNRSGPLRAAHAHDGETVQPGSVYVARPNHHLMIEENRVRSVTGPRESGYRPSVNVLFESAARAYGNRVVGIVLSGSLDDGALGLHTIKNAGGIAIVQDLADAVFTGMPRSALELVDADYRGSAAEIAGILVDISRTEMEWEPETVTSTDGNNPHYRNKMPRVPDSIEDIAGFTCPECGGALQEIGSERLVHFRCHVGHQHSEQALLHAQGDSLEKALWTALRILEERVNLAERAARRATDRGNIHVVDRLKAQNLDALEKAEVIREVLLGGNRRPPVTALQNEVGDDAPEVATPTSGDT